MSPQNVAKGSNWAFAFLGAVCLVLTLAGVQLQLTLRNERRSPAPVPVVSFDSVWKGHYFSALETHVKDIFFPRPALIAIDWKVFRKTRDDLVAGEDDFIFYRFIAEGYLASTPFPYERWMQALRKLRAISERSGKQFVFQSFRNKEYVYHEKLPYLWRKMPTVVPFRRLGESLRAEGFHVIDFTDELMAVKQRGDAFSFVEENHCSPEAFFSTMQKLLRTLGEISKRPVIPPRDFPKVVSEDVQFNNYRSAFRINTNYSNPAPWTRTEVIPGQGKVFEYVGGKNPLPATVFYGDSFMEVMSREFGEALLPYFERLTIHWGGSELHGWDDAEIVVVSLSDQTTGYVEQLEALVQKLEAKGGADSAGNSVRKK